jgi:cysteine-rich repeat protein
MLVLAGAFVEACSVPAYKYPPGAPKIVRFAATPYFVQKGATSSIAWSVMDADTVMIMGLPSGTMSVAAEGAISVSVEDDLLLMLVASNAGGTSQAIAKIEVARFSLVAIDSLTIDHDVVAPNEAVTVAWQTENATRVVLELSTGEIVDDRAPASGMRTLRPAESLLVELRAEGFGGPITATRSIAVRPLDPVIQVFRVMPRVIAAPETALIVWTVEHAENIMLSRASTFGRSVLFDGSPENGSGSIAVDATVGTSTLTLLATNSIGSASASTILYVSPPRKPEIDDFTVTPTVTGPNGDTLLRWSTSYAETLVLSVNGNVVFSNLPASGTRVFTAPGAGMSTPLVLELVAKSGTFTTVSSATLEVDADRPAVTASATPLAIASGSTTAIAWNAVHADRVTIATDSGLVLQDPAGSIGAFVYRPARSVTILVVATNGFGTTQKMLPLEVGPAPVIASFTVSSTLSRAGRPVDFAWRTTAAIRGVFLGSLFGNADLGQKISSDRRRFPAIASGTATVGIVAFSELFETRRSVTIQVVSSQASAIESEPDDVPELANGLYMEPSVVIDGALDPPSDVDFYAFQIPRGERMVAATTMGLPCAGPIAIAVYDDARMRALGSPVAAVVGTGVQCPSLLGMSTASLFPRALIGLSRAAQTSSSTPYRLSISYEPTRCGDGIVDYDEECDDGNTMSGDGCGPSCVREGKDEIEPNDIIDTATMVATNRPLSAYLALDDVDDYAFLTAGGPAMIRLESPSAGQCALDAKVSLFRASDRTLLGSDDADGLGCPLLSGLLLDPGRYVIEVVAGGGGPLPIRGAYRLTITAP